MSLSFSAFATKNVVLCASALLMTVALGRPALAQTPAQTGLKGITNLSLLVEKLSDDGEKCQLSQENLTEAIEQNLANSGITLGDGNYPTLYVQVNTAAASELCYSSVVMNIHYYAKVPHPTNPQGTVAQILLWSNSYLVSSEKSAHISYVQDQLKSGLGFLITDWQKQNGLPPRPETAATTPPVAKTP